MRSLKTRFWLILAFQTLLLLAIPAQAVYTHLTGRSIVLQTAPVDPYNLFQGYSVTLNYDISDARNLQKLPGWDAIAPQTPSQNSEPLNTNPFLPNRSSSQAFYVILQAPPDAATQPPKPWTAVAIAPTHPANLPPNQIALRGVYRQGQIFYGLETYFIPEEQRDEINQQIQQLQTETGSPPFVVEAKVGAGGKAIPFSFWLKQQRYQF